MVSVTDQHLRPYNPRQYGSNRTFYHFPQLPQELRLYVWELALPCERFLKVRLGSPSPTSSLPQGESAAAEKPDSGDQKDTIIISGRKCVPKLLGICKESRLAALKFYRVQLPCEYESNTDRNSSRKATRKGTFYFNPEFDILKVHPSRRKQSFADLLLDLRTNDPRNVGLLNLAMDLNDLGCNAMRNIALQELDPESKDDFIKTLSSLEKVYFISTESAGRMYLGPLNGIPGIKGWEMHRSLPIEGSVPKFQRFTPDPRNIEDDLKKVYLGTFEPRKMVVQWKKLLEKYGAKPHSEVEHRLMLACEPRPTDTEISDQNSAADYISTEDRRWHEELDKWQQRLKKTKIERETPQFLQTVPKTAIGFWLFPIEAIGKLPPDHLSLEDMENQLNLSKRVVDMTDYRPELGLLELY